ncbi:hypothetical protein GEMRC1_001301 [Eukaryota sp. GEM-RC1]
MAITVREQALDVALQHQFPDAKHALCLWHINKNVETHPTKHVRDNALEDEFRLLWRNVSDIESVSASLAEMDAKFEQFPVFLQYIHALITDYGKKFLGCHQVSTGNPADIVVKMVMMWKNILSEYLEFFHRHP